MGKSKPIKMNAFMLFLTEIQKKVQQESGHRLTLDGCKQYADPLWRDMAPEVKEIYKEVAKDGRHYDIADGQAANMALREVKRRRRELGYPTLEAATLDRPRPPMPKPVVDPKSLIPTPRFVDIEPLRRSARKEFRDQCIWHFVAPDKLKEERKFNILTVESFCDPDDGHYFPAEIAVLEYSLERGVTREWQMFVKPPDLTVVNQDWVTLANVRCDKILKIPHLVTGPEGQVPDIIQGSPNATLISLYQFLEIGTGGETGPELWYPFQKSRQVLYAMQYLKLQAGDKSQRLPSRRMHCVEDLAFCLLQFAAREEAQNVQVEALQEAWFGSSANHPLANSPLTGSGCIHHERLKVRQCALSQAKRMAYILSMHLKKLYDINFDIGHHCPADEREVCAEYGEHYDFHRLTMARRRGANPEHPQDPTGSRSSATAARQSPTSDAAPSPSARRTTMKSAVTKSTTVVQPSVRPSGSGFAGVVDSGELADADRIASTQFEQLQQDCRAESSDDEDDQDAIRDLAVRRQCLIEQFKAIATGGEPTGDMFPKPSTSSSPARPSKPSAGRGQPRQGRVIAVDRFAYQAPNMAIGSAERPSEAAATATISASYTTAQVAANFSDPSYSNGHGATPMAASSVNYAPPGLEDSPYAGQSVYVSTSVAQTTEAVIQWPNRNPAAVVSNPDPTPGLHFVRSEQVANAVQAPSVPICPPTTLYVASESLARPFLGRGAGYDPGVPRPYGPPSSVVAQPGYRCSVPGINPLSSGIGQRLSLSMRSAVLGQAQTGGPSNAPTLQIAGPQLNVLRTSLGQRLPGVHQNITASQSPTTSPTAFSTASSFVGRDESAPSEVTSPVVGPGTVPVSNALSLTSTTTAHTNAPELDSMAGGGDESLLGARSRIAQFIKQTSSTKSLDNSPDEATIPADNTYEPSAPSTAPIAQVSQITPLVAPKTIPHLEGIVPDVEDAGNINVSGSAFTSRTAAQRIGGFGESVNFPLSSTSSSSQDTIGMGRGLGQLRDEPFPFSLARSAQGNMPRSMGGESERSHIQSVSHGRSGGVRGDYSQHMLMPGKGRARGIIRR